jgi:hypothetical protein
MELVEHKVKLAYNIPIQHKGETSVGCVSHLIDTSRVHVSRFLKKMILIKFGYTFSVGIWEQSYCHLCTKVRKLHTSNNIGFETFIPTLTSNIYNYLFILIFFWYSFQIKLEKDMYMCKLSTWRLPKFSLHELQPIQKALQTKQFHLHGHQEVWSLLLKKFLYIILYL